MRRREKSYVSKFSLVGAAMLSVGILFSPAAFVHASERPQLRNPIIHENQVNEWDCVYFGSYPQHSDGEGGYLVEPIKWRVIKVEGDHAYLMSDQLIDCMRFNEEGEQLNTSCLYEVSTVRSWLNGYDASQNKMKIDYTDFNFIDRAFTQEEQAAIERTLFDSEIGEVVPVVAHIALSHRRDHKPIELKFPVLREHEGKAGVAGEQKRVYIRGFQTGGNTRKEHSRIGGAVKIEELCAEHKREKLTQRQIGERDRAASDHIFTDIVSIETLRASGGVEFGVESNHILAIGEIAHKSDILTKASRETEIVAIGRL